MSIMWFIGIGLTTIITILVIADTIIGMRRSKKLQQELMNEHQKLQQLYFQELNKIQIDTKKIEKKPKVSLRQYLENHI